VGQGKERRNNVRTGDEETGQTNTRKGEKFAGSSTELPSNFYSINRQEDVIQEGQGEDGVLFEDGTG
jgi:hypothetical protein